jgi:SAM-dependent methyltransferase
MSKGGELLPDVYRERRARAPSLSQSPLGPSIDLDWKDVDFIDLGCGQGKSIAYCKKRFGASRGVGVDLDEKKVAQAREAGVDAVLADATTLDLDGQIRFVSMMQFLEHLPDLATVEAVVRAATRSAKDFIFIHHPSFEGEEYLEALGLRQYWWHWTAHPSHIKISDYCRILDDAGLRQYMVRYLGPVHDSTDPSILPASAPQNQHDYDPAKHGPKPDVEFRAPLWRTQEIFVALRPLPARKWNRITAPKQRPA